MFLDDSSYPLAMGNLLDSFNRSLHPVMEPRVDDLMKIKSPCKNKFIGTYNPHSKGVRFENSHLGISWEINGIG